MRGIIRVVGSTSNLIHLYCRSSVPSGVPRLDPSRFGGLDSSDPSSTEYQHSDLKLLAPRSSAPLEHARILNVDEQPMERMPILAEEMINDSHKVLPMSKLTETSLIPSESGTRSSNGHRRQNSTDILSSFQTLLETAQREGLTSAHQSSLREIEVLLRSNMANPSPTRPQSDVQRSPRRFKSQPRQGRGTFKCGYCPKVKETLSKFK